MKDPDPSSDSAPSLLLGADPNHHYHFVTGRLAEAAVRSIVGQLSQTHSFAYSIGVMPITVAALMTPKWLKRHLKLPPEATHVIVPGYCESGLPELSEQVQIPVICGPNDCRDIPDLFGRARCNDDFGDYDIDIIAEINHAPRRPIEEVLIQARRLRNEGADVIDFGCDPSTRCQTIGDYIAALVNEGLTVSVDTFDSWEAEQAVRRGASLVLSVNSTNRHEAPDWGCEVVAIPDSPDDIKSFEKTIDFLSMRNVPFRLDPILEPIGAGFGASLVRYAKTRQAYPDAALMMGIGNLTELTDADSAGINLMLLGLCQEWRIRSVLTTQVINWARSSVRECDLARRLTHYAIRHGVPPKRLSDGLVMLRDAQLRPFDSETLAELATSLRDNNYRIFAQNGRLHLMAGGLHLNDDDPFRLFDRLLQENISDNVDAGHAFYLGYEMAKASIALTLGKEYRQDQALDWGILTKSEGTHRIKRTSRHRRQP